MILDHYTDISSFLKYARYVLKSFKESYNVEYGNTLYGIFRMLQIKYETYYRSEVKISIDLIACINLLCEIKAVDMATDSLLELDVLVTQIEADCDIKILNECKNQNLNSHEVMAEIDLLVQALLLRKNFDF